MRTLPLIILASALNLAVTCQSGSTEPTVTDPLPGTIQEAFQHARDLLRQKGFEVEEVLLDSGKMSSEWKINHGVHWKQMTREQVLFDVTQTPKGMVISVEVLRDVNDNASNPGDPLDASWVGAGNNDGLQLWFAYSLKRKLKPPSLDD